MTCRRVTCHNHFNEQSTNIQQKMNNKPIVKMVSEKASKRIHMNYLSLKMCK